MLWAQMLWRRIWNGPSGGYPPSHLKSKRQSKGTEVHAGALGSTAGAAQGPGLSSEAGHHRTPPSPHGDTSLLPQPGAIMHLPPKKIKENKDQTKKLHQDPCEDGIKYATIPSPSQGQAGVRAQDRVSPVAASPTPCHWRKQRCVCVSPSQGSIRN